MWFQNLECFQLESRNISRDVASAIAPQPFWETDVNGLAQLTSQEGIVYYLITFTIEPTNIQQRQLT